MTTDSTPVGHALYYWLRLVEGHLNRKLFGETCWTGPGRRRCDFLGGDVKVAQLYTVVVLRLDSKSCE